jgi:hypothetical protein
MSDRMTSIHLEGVRTGWAEYGRKTHAEMVAIIREKAAHDKAQAETILNAPEEAFVVQTHVGVIAQNKRERVYPTTEQQGESQ